MGPPKGQQGVLMGGGITKGSAKHIYGGKGGGEGGPQIYPEEQWGGSDRE